jgi:ABC-type molybdate transport system substrate-binding protein
VRPVAGKVKAVALPRKSQPTVLYEVAIAAKPESLEAAQSFVIALLSPDGRRELRTAGFGLP